MKLLSPLWAFPRAVVTLGNLPRSRDVHALWHEIISKSVPNCRSVVSTLEYVFNGMNIVQYHTYACGVHMREGRNHESDLTKRNTFPWSLSFLYRMERCVTKHR